mmetsp:Transcript_47855/g.121527  ORF Transcript_47855/g.121527 Transcript_47855/m.121527 type:complete len:205 (-) Transcript_47855:446-1060(-)
MQTTTMSASGTRPKGCWADIKVEVATGRGSLGGTGKRFGRVKSTCRLLQHGALWEVVCGALALRCSTMRIMRFRCSSCHPRGSSVWPILTSPMMRTNSESGLVLIALCIYKNGLGDLQWTSSSSPTTSPIFTFSSMGRRTTSCRIVWSTLFTPSLTAPIRMAIALQKLAQRFQEKFQWFHTWFASGRRVVITCEITARSQTMPL